MNTAVTRELAKAAFINDYKGHNTSKNYYYAVLKGFIKSSFWSGGGSSDYTLLLMCEFHTNESVFNDRLFTPNKRWFEILQV